MVNGFGLRFSVIPLVVFGTLSAGMLSAQEDARQLFQEGVRLIYQNKDAEALQKFMESIKADPTRDDAYEIWKATDTRMWEYLMGKGGEFEKIARRMQMLASLERKAKVRDQSAIRPLVEAALSDDRDQRRGAVLELMTKYGEFAVPDFIPALADNDNWQKQIYAVFALEQIGRRATLPLIRVLSTKNKTLRQNVALALRHIRDRRALPALKLLSESDKDAGVREIATRAVAEIGGSSVPSAVELYLQYSKRYLNGDTSLLLPDDLSQVVWSFDGEKLIARDVPPEIFPLELAKDAAYGALGINPESEAGVVALARTYIAEKAVVDAIVAHNPDADLKGVKPAVDEMAITVLACGPAALRAAVEANIQAGMAPAAVTAINALADVEDPQNLTGSPLVACLANSDKRIAYACALKLSSMDPNIGEEVRGQIVSVLSRAVLEQAVRIVKYIGKDTKVATSATSSAKGVWVDATASGRVAVADLRQFRNADVVVVDENVSGLLVPDIVDAIKHTNGLENTKIVVVAASKESAEKGWTGVDAVIQGPLTAIALQNKVAEVLEGSSLDAGRARAEKIAVHAAESLARLDTQTYAVANASASLAKACQRKGDIAIYSLQALGRAGTFETAADVAKVLQANLDNEAVAVAAADALGKLMARAGQAPEAFTSALMVIVQNKGNSAKVRAAAAAALGRAKLGTAARAANLDKLRVNAGSTSDEG